MADVNPDQQLFQRRKVSVLLFLSRYILLLGKLLAINTTQWQERTAPWLGSVGKFGDVAVFSGTACVQSRVLFAKGDIPAEAMKQS